MRAWWLGVVSLVLMAVACSSDEPLKAMGEGCVVNTDCASPLVCAFRKCHMACETSRDCGAGLRCVASDRPFHVCQLVDERNCTLNSDCPAPQICGVDLECRDQCATDRDCVKEQVCAAGTCADTKELQNGKLVAVPTEAGTVVTEGQPCLYTSECLPPLSCVDQICAFQCREAKDCPAGHDCVDHHCVAGSGTLIGSEGGTVSADSGRIVLTIPPGAMRGSATFLILPLEAWPKGALGPVFEVLPSGIAFDVPATLTYHYLPADIGTTAPADLHVGRALGATWTALPSTVDTAKQTVTASLEHLSVYGLVGQLPSDVGIAVDEGLSTDGGAKTDVAVGENADAEAGSSVGPDASVSMDASDASTSADAGTSTPDATADVVAEAPPPHDCTSDPLVFDDPLVLQAVQNALDTGGSITPADGLSVTNLTINGQLTAGLGGIECLTNLQMFSAFNANVTDITPLAGLTKLTQLNVGANHITDFSPLAGLTNLTSLDVFAMKSNSADLARIATLTKLQVLNLTLDSSVADISPLLSLTQLFALELESPTVTNLTPLGQLTSINSLYLGTVQVSDIGPLGNLTNLVVLTVDGKVTDLSPLAPLTRLLNLEVQQDFSLTDISVLSTFASYKFIQNLKIDYCGSLSNITVLSGMSSLTTLELPFTQVTDLAPLASLTGLQKLNLQGNHIVDISPLSGLTALTTLDLSSNAIVDISPLVANTGIGSGDAVDIHSNLLVCSDQASNLATLRGRNVSLTTDCP
jgi:Leucine-rich repeat (LRR) protein